MIRSLCKQGRLREALASLQAMKRPVKPSVYISLLRACADHKSLQKAKLVHLHMNEGGTKDTDIVLENTLVNAYAKCGSLEDARRVMDSMPKRNVVTWTVMMGAYSSQGYPEESVALYCRMRESGFRPNEFTFTTVISACARLGILRHGKEIHEEICRSGFQCHVSVANALVDMYVKCGSLENACQVFDKMPQRDPVSWTAVIAGYARNRRVDKALQLFEMMPERNLGSWNAMIAGCGQVGNVDQALKLFQEMPERDVVSWTAMAAAFVHNGYVNEALEIFERMPVRDLVSWNTMITGFLQNGQVGEALKLFNKMPVRSTVSWNAMIAGYVQNGCFDKALELFQQMRLSCVKPHPETFASVLPACANLVAFEQGKGVHVDTIKSGYHSNTYVGNALVDFYAKCGSIEDAYRVFEKMPRHNLVSWTTIIIGLAFHGFGKEASQLFERMQVSGTTPDGVTFVGVLSACGHAGLVDDGWRFFNSMYKDHQITPGREHYCCMVDLLGRAGHLKEAQDLIKRMPIEADSAMWLSLLCGCRIHNNVDLGEDVAEHLFEMEPNNVATYVLLSNIYAEAGRWDGIEKVRTKMRDKGVTKKPGCSWIEVNKEVYAFAA